MGANVNLWVISIWSDCSAGCFFTLSSHWFRLTLRFLATRREPCAVRHQCAYLNCFHCYITIRSLRPKALFTSLSPVPIYGMPAPGSGLSGVRVWADERGKAEKIAVALYFRLLPMNMIMRCYVTVTVVYTEILLKGLSYDQHRLTSFFAFKLNIIRHSGRVLHFTQLSTNTFFSAAGAVCHIAKYNLLPHCLVSASGKSLSGERDNYSPSFLREPDALPFADC